MGEVVVSEGPTAVAVVEGHEIEYRLERRGDRTVVVLHGGHLRASLALGEQVFAEAGCTILAPSRPGYGRTPLSTGPAPEPFVDVLAGLCHELGIERVAAVVGCSAGGRSAVAFAVRHPELVERVILLSSPGPQPWPDRRTRRVARIVFAPQVEGATWAVVRGMTRLAPGPGLRVLLRDLSTMPVNRVVDGLTGQQRLALLYLFARMRSGRGFRNDLRPGPDLTSQVRRPTLVVGSRRDGSVPFAHAQSLAATIPQATLLDSHAETHLLCFGSDWRQVGAKIRRFLDTS